MVVQISEINNYCPECEGGTINIQERGDIVCEYCGLVVHERELDISNSGVRAFNQQEKNQKERMGSPMSILIPDISLSTVMDKRNITNPDLKRAARWNTHMTWEKRNMLIAITELKRISTNLNIPMVAKKSSIKLYKAVFHKKILKGRSINGMIAACTYYVCKEENVPITFQNILDESSISPNIVKKCYKILIREMNLKSPNTSPIALIPKYVADLRLSVKIEKQVIGMLNNYISKNPVCGKDPRGVCAGAIYLVAKLTNKKISQKDISEIVGVTEVTLRSRYKEFLNHLCFNF